MLWHLVMNSYLKTCLELLQSRPVCRLEVGFIMAVGSQHAHATIMIVSSFFFVSAYP